MLAHTVKASLLDLWTTVVFTFIAMVLFATAVYYVECDEPDTTFYSVIHSFWWATITMTAVGYGDMWPVTFWGKLVASLCAITGVTMISLQVCVLMYNFNKVNGRYKVSTKY